MGFVRWSRGFRGDVADGALIEAQRKSTKWRVRSRVGERVRWYEEADEK
jgi:hypothetical protein